MMFQKITPRKKAIFRETAETILSALFLALLIRSFVVQPFKIPTGSMEPTLMPGDRILVLRYAYGLRIPFTFKKFVSFGEPKTGEIIVFNYPEDTKRAFIKRCIGTPEDEIEIKNGEIWINGKLLRDYPMSRIYYYNRGEFGKEGEELMVPPGSFFVLGDNSKSSKDSRYWGFLEDKYLLGKAVLIYWPLNRVRMLK